MITQTVKRTLTWVRDLLVSLYIEPLKETLIDFSQLSLSHKILTWGGYAAVFLLLLMTVFFEIFGARLPMVNFMAFEGSVQVSKHVPILVMIVSSLGLTLAWAYIMTGATDCRRRIFLPVLALFGAQLFFMTPFSGLDSDSFVSGLRVLPFCGSAPLLLLAVLGLYLFTHRKKEWRDYPLIEFAGWIVVSLYYLMGVWLVAAERKNVAEALVVSFDIMAFVALPWWFLNGLALVHAALGLGHMLMILLRRFLSGSLLRIFALFVVLVHPTVLLFATAFNANSGTPSDFFIALFVDGMLAIPLILLMFGLMIARRWNTKNAAMLLTLSFAIPLFSAGFVMAFSGKELFSALEMTAESADSFAPTLIFVLLMAYNVLSLGSAFANKDGEIAPRSGRVLLGLGAAILVISGTIFSVNIRDAAGELDQSFRIAVDAFFTLGVCFLGIPYLIWTAWKRREILSGDDEKLKDVVPLLSPLDKWMGRKVRIALTIAAVLLALLICFIGMLCIQPLPAA